MTENDLNKDVLLPTIDFLRTENIKRNKEIFYRDAIEELSNDIINIDKTSDIIFHYDIDRETNTRIESEYSFEHYLKTKIKPIYFLLDKQLLATTRILLLNENKKELFLFRKKVKSDYDFLLSFEVDKYERYPFIKELIKELYSILKKHSIYIHTPPFPSGTDYIPPFQISKRWSEKYDIEKKLKQLYTLLNNEGILLNENTNFEDFYKVFTGAKIDKHIRFECRTPFAVKILDTIKHIYDNFSPKVIEDSKRFVTKSSSNKLLKAKNYYTSIYRYNQSKPNSTDEIIISKIARFFPKIK